MEPTISNCNNAYSTGKAWTSFIVRPGNTGKNASSRNKTGVAVEEGFAFFNIPELQAIPFLGTATKYLPLGAKQTV